MQETFTYDGSWEHYEKVANALSTGNQKIYPWMQGEAHESFTELAQRVVDNGMEPPLSVRIVRADGTVTFLHPGTDVTLSTVQG